MPGWTKSLKGMKFEMPKVRSRGQVLFLVSRPVCQPADRSVVQVQKICNLSLAVPVAMYRPDNQCVSLGLG